MFKNYLLLSLKVLKRKPLYTFISLFGISFTLMILMLLTSLFDAALGDNKPLGNRDLIVMAPMLERTRVEIDTILTIDSVVMNNGVMRYDTAMTFENNTNSTSNGPMGYKFIQANMMDFEMATKSAIFNDNVHVDGYLDGRKFSFSAYFVNTDYWDVFDFDFLYGGPLNADDEAEANKVIVLTDKSAEAYFGEVSASLIGREMVLGEETFTVRGIVSRPLSDSPFFAGDVYVPVTTGDPRSLGSDELNGSYGMAFLVEKPEHRRLLQEEINYMTKNYDMSADENYTNMEVFNAAFIEGYAQAVTREDDPAKAIRILFIPIIALLLLFVALPLINLVNLNISRVYERKAEIGVRKAFGANGQDILYQFVFENMVVTLIGGLIGMLLAVLLIGFINENDLLGVTRLSYSFKVFAYFLLVILLFGFLSGILPAYRMSRTNVANSLR